MIIHFIHGKLNLFCFNDLHHKLTCRTLEHNLESEIIAIRGMITTLYVDAMERSGGVDKDFYLLPCLSLMVKCIYFPLRVVPEIRLIVVTMEPAAETAALLRSTQQQHRRPCIC
jgi:hypothetical protein